MNSKDFDSAAYWRNLSLNWLDQYERQPNWFDLTPPHYDLPDEDLDAIKAIYFEKYPDIVEGRYDYNGPRSGGYYSEEA